MLSVELSPSNVSDHEIFQINSVSVSAMTNILAAEWSHNMFTAVSQLLKYYQAPHGILKKQQQENVDYKDVITDSDRSNKQDTDKSTLFISKWCALREDLEELDLSFNFVDINFFLYNNTPCDPSILLRMDNCCVKTLEIHSGKMEDLVLVIHCNNFILLPFSVDHVIEVSKNVMEELICIDII